MRCGAASGRAARADGCVSCAAGLGLDNYVEKRCARPSRSPIRVRVVFCVAVAKIPCAGWSKRTIAEHPAGARGCHGNERISDNRNSTSTKAARRGHDGVMVAVER